MRRVQPPERPGPPAAAVVAWPAWRRVGRGRGRRRVCWSSSRTVLRGTRESLASWASAQRQVQVCAATWFPLHCSGKQRGSEAKEASREGKQPQRQRRRGGWRKSTRERVGLTGRVCPRGASKRDGGRRGRVPVLAEPDHRSSVTSDITRSESDAAAHWATAASDVPSDLHCEC